MIGATTIGHEALLDYGVVSAALDDAPESGDRHVVASFDGGVLAAVIDGLGHGSEAALAARAAARILEADPGRAPIELLQRCHEALRSTRGAVMSLARFEARASSMTWLGVGNVDAVLLRADPASGRAREALTLRGGVVGFQLPSLRTSSLPVAPGDTLILTTDGVRSGFGDGVALEWAPQLVAESLLALYASGRDDALVLVARWRGAGA